MSEPLTLDQIMAAVRGEVFPEQEKVASAAPQVSAPVAATAAPAATDLESLLTKSAGVNVALNTNEDSTHMNKVAQAQGKALADALIANIVKQANAVVDDSGNIVAQAMAQQAATPREGMSVTDTLKGLIMRGIGRGAATNEVSEMAGPGEEVAQGAVAGATPYAPPAQPNGTALGSIGEMSPEQEKAACVFDLVNEGVQFDHAVALVKQAEEDMAAETIHMAKMAAFQDLVNAGVDYNQAVTLVEGSAANLGL